MKSPISYKVNISCSVNVWCVHPFLTDSRNCTNICLFAEEKWLEFTINFNMKLLILLFSGLRLLWASIVNEVNHHRTLYRAKRSIFTKSMGVFIISESNFTSSIFISFFSCYIIKERIEWLDLVSDIMTWIIELNIDVKKYFNLS